MRNNSSQTSEKIEIDMEMLIGGVKVNYFFHCKTQLWLFSHFITQEQESELVLLGKIIEEVSFKEIKVRNVLIDQKISIDLIKSKEYLILHDVKKSSKFEVAHFYQLLYYLWYLKTLKGLEKVKGVIDYPKERKKIEVTLTREKDSEIRTILEQIHYIISLPKPPEPIYKSYCRKCAYFEFCWIE
ncbi:MAG: CRISPR-associated protein Cas4 [Candidatus Aenigmatarchaeota archaeon]